MRRRAFCLLAVVLLLAGVTVSVRAADMVQLEELPVLTPIARSYLDQYDVSGRGQLYVTEDGTIWVRSNEKPYVLQYSIDGGFIKAHPFAGVMAFGKDQAYFLENKGVRPATTALPEPGFHEGDSLPARAQLNDDPFSYNLYAANKEQGLVIDRVVTLDPNLSARQAAINSNRIFLVGTSTPMEDNKGVVHIRWSALGSVSLGSATIDLDERIYGIHGCVADDKNLFVLLWTDSGKYVYRLAADTLELQSKYLIPHHVMYNPGSLILTDRSLYVTGDDRVVRFRVGRDGELKPEESTDFGGTGLRAYTDGIFPYRNGYVVLGTYKGDEGLYYYDVRRSQVRTIYKPTLPASALIRPDGIAAIGNRVVVTSGQSLKVFVDGLLQSQINGLPQGLFQLAVNQDGIIAGTSNSCDLVIIRKGKVQKFTYPSIDTFLFGIAAAPDGTFIIRPRGGPGRTVVRFDPATNTFTKLFDLPNMLVRSDEIAVLPDGNLALNWTDNQLKVLSTAGEVLVEGPEYEHSIVALTYSPFHQALVVLAYGRFYGVPASMAVLLIDPQSLQITRVIPLEIEQQLVGLAVSPRGRIYVSSLSKGVFEVRDTGELAEQVE